MSGCHSHQRFLDTNPVRKLGKSHDMREGGDQVIQYPYVAQPLLLITRSFGPSQIVNTFAYVSYDCRLQNFSSCAECLNSSFDEVEADFVRHFGSSDQDDPAFHKLWRLRLFIDRFGEDFHSRDDDVEHRLDVQKQGDTNRYKGQDTDTSGDQGASLKSEHGQDKHNLKSNLRLAFMPRRKISKIDTLR